ncbi:unnamed protein product [Staurois parvus]|uniref:Cation-independent mannose-6-phosphate receptor n=1 Tax=Staurois parvus TaxID=386267 RepID=A0ABN9BC20_9NEOB|nr:unnamed protein product [Staurois parvus]
MQMEYSHLQDMLVLRYVGGDPCPPVTESDDVCVLPFTYKGKTYSTCISEERLRPWCPTSSDFEKNNKWDYCSTASERRSSTILFKCDERVAKGAPTLVSDTKGCSATFEWKTKLVCLPTKLDCKFIIDHKSYDLRMLSSLTGSWSFAADGSKYYLNLCQRVNQGPSACSESASVCQERNGRVQVLGQVHTQKVTVKGDIVLVTYSGGDSCGNDKQFSTTIQLTCANVTGKPKMKQYNSESCQYIFTWETRAACAVIPKEVVMAHGIIYGDNGASVNLSGIYIKSYNASGDQRVTDQYMYEIQLSGRENSAYQKCNGASVCQVKTNGQFTRPIGSPNQIKYYIDDDSLEAVFSSNSKCGKDPQKNATSTIFFYCSQTEGEGRPEFLHETADCQYLFSWYTTAICPLVPENSASTTDDGDQNQYQGLSGRSQAVGAILSILLVILVICLVVLLLYKKERRETMMYKLKPTAVGGVPMCLTNTQRSIQKKKWTMRLSGLWKKCLEAMQNHTMRTAMSEV